MPHPTFQPLDFTSLLLSLSPLSLSLSHTLSRSSSRLIEPISLVLFLPLSIWLSCGACTISISCGYPVADSRHESRHHPAGVRRGNAKRQTGSPSPSPFYICLTDLSVSLSFSISFPPHLYLYLVLSYRLSFSFSLFLPLLLVLSSSSCLSRSLPIYRKVMVPGMRLIPREYQELSKRTEVGWAMPLSRRWYGCCWWDRFFFPALPRDPKARTRRSQRQNKCDNSRNSAFIPRWQCFPIQWISRLLCANLRAYLIVRQATKDM